MAAQRRRQRQQRQAGGRQAPAQRSPLPMFYLLLGALAIGGVIILLIVNANNQPIAPLDEAAVAQAVKPFDAPVGTTEEGFYFKGAEDAPVVVTEYSDFQCPFCGTFAQRIAPQLTEEYVETGKVRFVYRDFPLPSHGNAIPAAAAARCAADQDPAQFWPMHDLLFARQAEWERAGNAPQRFATYATALGLDGAALEQCVTSGTYTAELEAAQQSAIASGVDATPTIFVNDQRVPLSSFETAYSDIKTAIDAALAAEQ